MAANSAIQWTDDTWNAWIGCTRKSAGCKNCYAEAQMGNWLKRAEWGDSGRRVRTSEAYWKKLGAWDRALNNTGKRRRVFCSSLSDIFEIPKINPDEVETWRQELWPIIGGLKNLDMLLLTKRPENISELVPKAWSTNWPRHVWTGTSMEDQKSVDRYFPLTCVPGKHFLSIEPLLEPLKFESLEHIHWVIVGGESGPNARPLKLEWVEDIAIQCGEAGVPVFIKQLGTYWAKEAQRAHDAFARGHRIKATKIHIHKKGGDIEQWPDRLQIRMLPSEFQEHDNV